MVGYLLFSFPQELRILPIKQKSPLSASGLKSLACFGLQRRPSHEDVWPAKSIPKPKGREINGRRVGRADHVLAFPVTRASVFRLPPNDNRILSGGFYRVDFISAADTSTR